MPLTLAGGYSAVVAGRSSAVTLDVRNYHNHNLTTARCRNCSGTELKHKHLQPYNSQFSHLVYHRPGVYDLSIGALYLFIKDLVYCGWKTLGAKSEKRNIAISWFFINGFYVSHLYRKLVLFRDAWMSVQDCTWVAVLQTGSSQTLTVPDRNVP